MRLNELVRSLLPEGGTVVDRIGSDHAWPPLMKVSGSVPAQPADDVLTAVTVGDNATADEVRTTLDGAAPGEWILILLPWPAHQLPVGPVIQGLVSAGAQVVEAHPLADTAWKVALVCRRVDDQVQDLHAYLDRRRSPAPLTGSTLLRLVDEHVVEGLVWRTQELRAKETLRVVDAAVAARDELAAERDAAREERDTVTAEAQRDRDAAQSEQDRLARQLDEAVARAQHAEKRLQGIVESRTYQVARTAARAARTPGRWVGKRQG